MRIMIIVIIFVSSFYARALTTGVCLYMYVHRATKSAASYAAPHGPPLLFLNCPLELFMCEQSKLPPLPYCCCIPNFLAPVGARDARACALDFCSFCPPFLVFICRILPTPPEPLPSGAPLRDRNGQV